MRERRPRRPRPASRSLASRNSAGLTLVELLLAMTVTAIMGMAIAQMLIATSSATNSRNDMRALITRQKALTVRLDEAIRGSTMVLASGSNYLVLWMGDTRADDVPNLSEIRRIEYDSSLGQLISYKAVFPGSWTQAAILAADTQYALTSNFNTVTTGLKGSSTFPAEIWSRNIAGWSITLNNASAQSATLVSYRITTTNGVYSNVIIGAVSPRTP
ncbi:MAG: prepilin-type N-terminal cleavage/methylation domain-containing protein [Planctomycetota bacterium]|nr:prepilin-type N-terminal cleavage/methylation domain-containing protein [Planctomycetota bacterium]